MKIIRSPFANEEIINGYVSCLIRLMIDVCGRGHIVELYSVANHSENLPGRMVDI